MKDIASKRTKKEGAKSAPSERTLMRAEFMRDNLFAFVVREGMKALDVLLERDREAVRSGVRSGPSGGERDPLGHTRARRRA